jgi:hypothetical protein
MMGSDMFWAKKFEAEDNYPRVKRELAALKALLLAYIEHVSLMEGTDFMGSFKEDLSQEQLTLLASIELGR